VKPRVVITIGDPSGIGPEVTLKALAHPKIAGCANFLVIGDRSVIESACSDMRLRFKAPLVDLENVPRRTFRYGRADAAFGRASVEYLDEALRLLKEGRADCMVTAPVNKSSIRAGALPDFEGHTEYLAGHTSTRDYAMMFVGDKMKITLVTRHIALKDVPRRLTISLVHRAILLTDTYLKKYFRIRNGRIGVAGLNPHAGEGGSFGNEEARVIIPAMKKASASVKGLAGPIPPDVIFNQARAGTYDAVISMYHDQALIPFKLLYFKDGVNLTLGLPFVRTSPDHGTAFDIAGKGVADPSSMIEAIRLAARLASKA
jgi:4-hydroxythreonine-4-phosphate dehydrogenase